MFSNDIGGWEKYNHLNSKTHTPPVDVPLIIEVDGQLMRAERKHWARSHNDDLEFHTENGIVRGRFSWTYP